MNCDNFLQFLPYFYRSHKKFAACSGFVHIRNRYTFIPITNIIFVEVAIAYK